MIFPVGYHSLHPNVSMNFQMNRLFGCVGEPEMLEEMRKVAPRISTYVDWKREFVALAESASGNGEKLAHRFGGEVIQLGDLPDRLHEPRRLSAPGNATSTSHLVRSRPGP